MPTEKQEQYLEEFFDDELEMLENDLYEDYIETQVGRRKHTDLYDVIKKDSLTQKLLLYKAFLMKITQFKKQERFKFYDIKVRIDHPDQLDRIALREAVYLGFIDKITLIYKKYPERFEDFIDDLFDMELSPQDTFKNFTIKAIV
jgi:hypothetical protein